MSRVTTQAPNAGEVMDAADANSNFSSFTVTDLNDYNVRDAGIDYTQLDSNIIVKYQTRQPLGVDSWNHAMYRTFNCHTTTGS